MSNNRNREPQDPNNLTVSEINRYYDSESGSEAYSSEVSYRPSDESDSESEIEADTASGGPDAHLPFWVLTMSSSDEAGDCADVERDVVNRTLFVRLLSENSVVIEKSKVPSVMCAKKKAWDIICSEYSKATRKIVTPAQLSKMLNNMKTKIKKKTDRTATGNKLKLKDWEKEFLLLLTQEENPVFKKVPGAASVGICEGESAKNTTSSKQKGADNMEVEHQPSCSVITSKQPVVAVRKGAKRLSMLETDETRDMSTPKLQRAVLLQQIELQKIQIEKERILQNNLKKTVNDASTDTEDLFSLFD
ncbi:hypothetical protein J6590_049316 [Homalodisca vitripennis]|nr:hypothetical protein J6590_049316 [Homalodisca vitripennis]